MDMNFMMNVINFENCGPSEVLRVESRPIPRIENDEVLLKVIATTVTGFDLWRRSLKKDWKGIHPLLGMECSGIVVAVGSNHLAHRIGDEVCALLGGGGYAEYVAVPAWRVVPIPNRMTVSDAAALPYAASVVWYSLFKSGKLLEKKNCSILIHGGTGEFGQLAIQLAKKFGHTVLASSTFKGEMKYCKDLGADCIEYDNNFIDNVLKKTDGRGVDFIFDALGVKLSHNLTLLSQGGTLVICGEHDRSNVLLNHRLLAKKQIKLVGHLFVLLPVEEKQQILREIVENLWPLYERGHLDVRVYKDRYHLKDAAAAHLAMEWNANLGDKILLLPHAYPIILGYILVMIFFFFILSGIVAFLSH